MALKVLNPEEVSEIVGVSTATLERYRNDGEGPNFLRIGPGGLIKYLESDVEEWLKRCRQLPSDAEKMRAAATHGIKEAGAAIRSRVKEMQALDREDTIDGVTPLTMSGVGATPGENFQKFNSVPAQTVVAPPSPHMLNCR